MTRAEDLAAKASRLRERQSAAAPPAEVSAPGSSSVGTEVRTPGVRVRPVRLTVDVSPADHAALARWCLDAAEELGVARVYGQELVRALLSEALGDAQARARVTRLVGSVRAE